MQKVIEKWKLNKGHLASKMNMPLGTFCNKLNPKHTASFSDAEIIQLKGVLRELSADLDAVTDIDFNDALNAIVK
jgi:hypothetical protein